MAEREPGQVRATELHDLEENSPDLAPAVGEALKQGIPSEEILPFVRKHPKFKAGLDAGISEDQIFDYLGLGDFAKAEKQKTQAAEFGFGRSALNALTLGGSKVAEAATSSGAMPAIEYGSPFGLPPLPSTQGAAPEAPRPSFGEAYKGLEAKQGAYEAEHPALSTATNIAGTLPATALGLSALKAGTQLVAGGSRLGNALTGVVRPGAGALERSLNPLVGNAVMGGEAATLQAGVEPGEFGWRDVAGGAAAGADDSHLLTVDLDREVGSRGQRWHRRRKPVRSGPRTCGSPRHFASYRRASRPPKALCRRAWN